MDESAVEVAGQGAVEGAAASGLSAEAGFPTLPRRLPDPRDGVPEGVCANCGAVLKGFHCHVCGQTSRGFHRPIWVLIIEALETLFALDGRFWRTAPRLLTAPGDVTAIYLAGARARFVQPFRLFLFTSIIFFVLANAVAGDPRSLAPPEASRGVADAVPSGASTPAPSSSERDGSEAEPAGGSDGASAQTNPVEAATTDRLATKCTVRATLTPELPASPACAALPEDARQTVATDITWGGASTFAFRERLADSAVLAIDRPDAYVAALQRWAPRIAVGLFPLYALLIAVLYVWRRDLYLYDHLVFSLHFHTFVLLLLMIAYIGHHAIGVLWSVVAFIALSNWGLYRMQRVALRASVFGALMRVAILDGVYFVLLSIALSVVLMLGLVFL